MWNAVSVDPKAGGVYVVIDRYACQGHNSFIRAGVDDYLGNIEAALVLMGAKVADITLYGIKRAAVDSFKKKGEWVELFDYAKSLAEKSYISHKNSAQKHKTLLEFLNHIGSMRADTVTNIKPEGLVAGHPLNELAKTVKDSRASRANSDVSKINETALSFGITPHLFDETELNMKKEAVDLFFHKYPMLNWMGHDITPTQEKAMLDYIKLIDSTEIESTI